MRGCLACVLGQAVLFCKKIRTLVRSAADRVYNKFHLSRAVFYRLLYSYLFILVVTILLSSITYQQSNKIINKNCRELKLSMLNQTKSDIDNYMSQIDQLGSELIFNPKLTTMLYQDKIENGSSDIYNVYTLSKNLQQNTINSNSFQGDFYILFKKSNRVFSCNSTYLGLDNFYRNILSYDGVNYQTWYHDLFDVGYSRRLLPSRKMKREGAETSAITYIYTLPFNNTSGTSLGAIVFVIEEKQIQAQLSKSNIDGQGWIGILNANGQVISKDSQNPYYSAELYPNLTGRQGYFYRKIGGENMMVLYTKSNYNRWIYTAILPTDVIDMDARNIQNLAMMILTVTFVLGIAVCFLMAYQNSKPIKKVFSMVRAYTEQNDQEKVPRNTNELQFLEANIAHIIRDRSSIESDLKANVQVLQSIFLEKLLKYGFEREEEMNALMRKAELDITGDLFLVAMIQADPVPGSPNPPQSGTLKQAVEEHLIRSAGYQCYPVSLGGTRFAVLLAIPSEGRQSVIHAIADLQESLEKKYPVTVSCGVGKAYHRLADVSKSFAESFRAVELCGNVGAQGQAVWYESLEDTVNGYDYPLNVEIRLINACKAGRLEETRKILDKVYHENFEASKLSVQAKKLFFYNLSCTLMKLAQEVRTDPDQPTAPVGNFDRIQSSEEAFSHIREQFLAVCRQADNGKKSHNIWLRDNIRDFIEKRYADPNMGVEMIAKQFHLSPSYFSQFFKEQMGETFTVYLENIRIQEACLKMERESIPVETLARQVGYNSVYSFRRAFKKTLGITPCAYRANTRDCVSGTAGKPPADN